MYQFTTTNVINTQYALDYNGNRLVDGNGTDVPKYSSTSTLLRVRKVGDFKKAGILSIYKRPYSVGVKEVATLTVASITSGNTAKLTIEVALSGSTNSVYANWTQGFSKPITVEVISAGITTTDAAALTTQLNALQSRFGYKHFNATSSGAVITLTAKEDVQRFKSITLVETQVDTTSLALYKEIEIAAGVVTVPGAMGFGDDAWMIRTIFVPTAENVRYFGISRDERPILGGNYTEYALRYSITKDGNDGIVSGGTSVTTHIFYVLSTLADAFEAVLAVTFPGIITIGGDQDLIIVGDSTISATTTTGAYSVLNMDPTKGLSGLVYSDAALTTASSAAATVTITGGSASSGSTPSNGAAGVITFDIQKVGSGGTVYIKLFETGSTTKLASMKVVVS